LFKKLDLCSKNPIFVRTHKAKAYPHFCPLVLSMARLEFVSGDLKHHLFLADRTGTQYDWLLV